MEGTAEHPGLIPRAAVKLFDGSRAKEGWNLSYKISSFQIYNNEVQDLLGPGAEPVHRNMISTSSDSVEIRDLNKMKVFSAEEILYYFDQASQKRTQGATKKNATSSRSHFIFKIDIKGERSGDLTTLGHIYFVDLAGSEALDAGKTEEQKAEGADIRKSLTALKTFLIRAAKNQKGDARTWNICKYMQFVLSRPEAKFLVIANISADASSLAQTKDSLDFIEDISKLKRFEKDSPTYKAALKYAVGHDDKITAASKPWKANRQNHQRNRKEIEFYGC
jgi:hypothetical protein